MAHGHHALREDEILEMLLFHAIPRRDVKPLSKQLIKKFGSLERVIFAPPEKLETIDGVKLTTIAFFQLLQRLRVDFKKAEFEGKTILSNWQSVIDFCRAEIGFEEKEVFAVLFLNASNTYIDYIRLSTGTVDKVSIYPREILEKAIALKAKAVVLAHNHPGGNPTPSKQDIAMTRQINDSLETVNISLHDHLIITEQSHSSFKSLGLI